MGSIPIGSTKTKATLWGGFCFGIGIQTMGIETI